MARKDIELLQQRGVPVTEESLTRGELGLLLKLSAELAPSIPLAFDLIQPVADVQTVGGISGGSMHQAVLLLSSALLSQRELDWPELQARLTSGPQIDVDLVLAILLKEGLAATRRLSTTPGAHDKPPTRKLDGTEPDSKATAPTKAKRSTVKGEARVKLIAALTKHHEYANGSCLKLDPIGSNELARSAGVVDSSASKFFKQEFKGHEKYRAICRCPRRLADSLKALNDEFSPHDLYGRRPVDEDDRDADE